MYRFPDPSYYMQQPGLGVSAPPMQNSPVGIGSMSPMMGQQMSGGLMEFNDPTSAGIGNENMMSIILPMLMSMMQPGVGGFQSQPSRGGYGTPRPQMASPYSPLPTGGINRGSFSF